MATVGDEALHLLHHLDVFAPSNPEQGVRRELLHAAATAVQDSTTSVDANPRVVFNELKAAVRQGELDTVALEALMDQLADVDTPLRSADAFIEWLEAA